MSRLKNKGIFLFILAVALLYAVIYLVPRVTGLLDVTYVAEYGELVISDETPGYLVRDEKVYTAVSGGTATRLAKEGELLRVGTPAIELSGSSGGEPSEAFTAVRDKLGDDVLAVQGYAVETGGLVSYYVDGLESELTLKKALSSKESYFTGLSQDNVLAIPQSVPAGYPAFKLMSNGYWYLVAYVDEDRADRYREGGYVYVSFDPDAEHNLALDGVGEVEMMVYDKKKQGDRVRLILETGKFFEELGQLRVANVRITSSSIHGLILEADSLVEVDGVTGVYVMDKKGKYAFTPVKVLDEDGGKVVVADSYFYDKDGNQVRTLDNFDDVLKNPDIGEDGSAEEPEETEEEPEEEQDEETPEEPEEGSEEAGGEDASGEEGGEEPDEGGEE